MSLISQFYNDSPFNDPFFQDFNHLFNIAFDARTGSNDNSSSNGQVLQRGQNNTLRPRMDIHESKESNQVTATFELPGLKKEDVSIDIQSNRLTVSGSSSLSNELEKDGYSVRERRYGRFARSIPLPTGIKPEDIKARMENGILTVVFPKTTAEQAPKKITIN